MSTYAVILTRDVTESVVMRVDATTPEQAEDNALRALSESETAEWTIDEGSWNDSDIYVTDVTDVTEEAPEPFAFVEGVNEYDQLAPDGQNPPFSVFIPSMQRYLPLTFRTWAEADDMASILRELKT